MNPLEVRGLVKRYPGFELACDFTVPHGYVMGLVGANGSGKTTLIKCALGAVNADAGELQLVDKRRVGVVLDSPPYAPTWKVGQTGRSVGNFFENWDHARFEELCAKWELPAGRKVKDLSRGMGMRLQMAIALAHDAEFLILDEPTSGLDPLARDNLIEDLAEYMTDENHSILFSSHITSDLEKIADYVTVLDGGRVLACDEVHQLKGHYRMVQGGGEPPSEGVIGLRQHSVGWEGLAEAEIAARMRDVQVAAPSLEDVVIRLAKQGSTDRKERAHA